MEGDFEEVELGPFSQPTYNQSVITQLNKATLCAAFKRAAAIYRVGTSEGVDDRKHRGEILGWKNAYSLCTSVLFRVAKSVIRMPSLSTVTDENAKELLRVFLTSVAGGKDLLSFKYLVVSQLLGREAHSDIQAKQMVNALISELNMTNGVSAKDSKLRSKIQHI